MSSHLAPILEQLASDREALRSAVARIPVDMRDRRIREGEWSVAEILEHLAIVEGGVAKLMTHFASTAPARDASSAPPQEDAKRGAFLDREARRNAPERVQPTGTVGAAAAMEALEKNRAALLAAVEGAIDRDLSAVSRAHPAVGDLNGYEWLLAHAGHEARHAAQIEEMAGRVVA